MLFPFPLALFPFPFPSHHEPYGYSHSHGIPMEMGFPWGFPLPCTPLISAHPLKNSKIVTRIITTPVVAVVGTVVTVLTVLTVGVVAVVADSVVNVVGALVLSTTHKHTRAFLSNSSVKNLQAIYR